MLGKELTPLLVKKSLCSTYWYSIMQQQAMATTKEMDSKLANEDGSDLEQG